MKKYLFLASLMLSSAALFTACGSDDDPKTDPSEEVITIESLDYTNAYRASWNNYMNQVAKLLKKDAHDLHEAWTYSYKSGDAFRETFSNHNGNGYNSATDCIDAIVEAMADIASEVGDSKIGGPADEWAQGNKKAAVLQVESWYSWHSIDDYTNNIRSIRNAYYGKYFGESEKVAIQAGSMAQLMNTNFPLDHTDIVAAIDAAIAAIQAIPAPFRNHIASEKVTAAIEACATLEGLLTNTLLPDMRRLTERNEAAVNTMITNYVNNVVVPTYEDLDNKVSALAKAVENFIAAPSDAGFKTLANAWMAARRPWESSEAFLFGPVDELQLDPNMDSWPLDQDGIENNIKAGNFDNINWTDGDDDDDIEAAQNLRGFHTLEFLIFKDGKARTIVAE